MIINKTRTTKRMRQLHFLIMSRIKSIFIRFIHCFHGMHYTNGCCILSNMTRWKLSKTAIFNLSYHLIWCPKYRRKVLGDDVKDRLIQLLQIKASMLNLEIIEVNVQPDHVHLFVKTIPIHSPQFIVGQLKGYTSRILREEFPSLRSRLPTLWTRSYYVDSVGKLNEHTIRKYIQEQDQK